MIRSCMASGGSAPLPARSARHGFSLLELAAVMLIMSVLTAVIMVREGGLLGTGRVSATAEALIQNLAFARTRAMSTTNTWTFAYGAAMTLTRDGAVAPLPDPSTATAPDGVTISAGSVTFDGFGAPDAGQGINVSDGTHTRTVTVWAETGLVE